MIDYHCYCQIKHLHDQQGLNVTQIAQELSLDPRTVAYWLDQDHFRSRKCTNRPRKLDPFLGHIEYYLSEEPFVSITEIHQRLLKLGFSGSDNSIKEYLSKRRAESCLQSKFIKFPFSHERETHKGFQEIGYIWVLKLLQGSVKKSELKERFLDKLSLEDIENLEKKKSTNK